MNILKRYPKPFSQTYRTIRKEAQLLDPDGALQAVVMSTNDNVGPNELVPTILV